MRGQSWDADGASGQSGERRHEKPRVLNRSKSGQESKRETKMPRVRVWFDKETMENNPGDNNPVDYCRKCWPIAKEKYAGSSLAEITGDDHPPYEDTDYICEKCGKPLTAKDD
jgi:hypothetical protein